MLTGTARHLPMVAAAALAAAACGGDPIDDVADAVRDATLFTTEDGKVSLDFDFYLTMDNLFMSQPPPPLIVNPNNYLPNPRLSMLGQFDYDGWLTLFALGRVDRGFDPTDDDAQVRPDEYYLQLDPFGGHVRFTAGKFGTSYGQWGRRYFEWDNPMTNAPLVYDWMTTVGDGNDAPTVAPTRAAFLARKNQVVPRSKWLPAVWGPSYTSGFRFDGTSDIWDYALEVKNDALSSRPSEWDLWNHGLYGSALSWTGRLGVRPMTDWNIGVSGSAGAYLIPNAPGVPAGSQWFDYLQRAVCVDVAWAHGPVEVWAEAHWSSFDVPGEVGTVGLWSWFAESRWKVSPGWWLSGRFNQQLYDDIPDGLGGTTPWDNDVWRVDACVGWKVDRTVTVKFQYSYADESGPVGQGRNLFDLQLIFAF